ncbi:MAG: hypothetical protein JSR80_04635 [Verrucomicrobia bacterium]|nr:hypothetical protein [Verrucomicrobiota bacterium]
MSDLEAFSVEQAAQLLTQQLDLTPLASRASHHVIENEESAKWALSMNLQAKKIRKQLKEKRLSIIRPHFNFQKALNKIAKEYEVQLEGIEEHLKTQLVKYLQGSDAKGMSVNEGKLIRVKKWVWELEQKDLVPREYLSLDPYKIDEAVKQGVRNIPGIKIAEQEDINFRIKNSSSSLDSCE